jgi:hypothetical protein
MTHRARPFLEGLETRLAPANIFVVPDTQPQDVNHLRSLQQAIHVAGPGGLVIIEPGTSPEPSSVLVAQNGITIEGDPSVPSTILTRYDNLMVNAHSVTLRNLHLNSLQIGMTPDDMNVFANTVNNCAVVRLRELGRDSTFTQNTFTDFLTLEGADDVVANNTFRSLGPDPLLDIDGGTGMRVIENTFERVLASGQRGISVGPVSSTTPTIIANNRITVLSGMGIVVHQQVGVRLQVNILNNSLSGGADGTGISLQVDDPLLFGATVQGNYLHDHDVGIVITGNGGVGTIDLGGGALGSLETVSKPTQPAGAD